MARIRSLHTKEVAFAKSVVWTFQASQRVTSYALHVIGARMMTPMKVTMTTVDAFGAGGLGTQRAHAMPRPVLTGIVCEDSTHLMSRGLFMAVHGATYLHLWSGLGHRERFAAFFLRPRVRSEKLRDFFNTATPLACVFFVFFSVSFSFYKES